MNFEDLIKRYEEKKQQYGQFAYKYVSEILASVKEQHYQDWLKKPTRKKDHEQSWKAWKGKNLEKLVSYIIKDEVEHIGLKVVAGNKLEISKTDRLTPELSKIKKDLLIDYGEFGLHLPDLDLIIYEPTNCRIIAVLSSKATLRERIAQTGYWKLKFMQSSLTKHIKVFFVTPDEDKTLSSPPRNGPVNHKWKKGRAIVEMDTNGSYVMTEEEFTESAKVKKFDKLIEDLTRLIKTKQTSGA